MIALSDALSNAGTVPPAQIVSAVPKLNVGMIFGSTVTVNVVVVAHNPAVGVNVYVAEFWLLTDKGLHVPVIPFADVVGNIGTAPLSQIVKEVPKLNVGVILGFTVTVNVVGVAHNPAVGVKVYVPEVWSFTIAGLHVPVIPLSDELGNAGTVPPAQIVSDVPKLNVGVIFGFTVTVNVVVVAHNPGVGVNV